jgi:general secretion pathway protein I
MTHPRPHHAQQGLSLLELLVAFTIMALSIGLLYRSMGGSARSVADMAQQQQAALVAESVLALRDAVTPEGWNETGTSAGFAWVVSSQPFVATLPWPLDASGAPQPADRVSLHEIRLSVFWADGRRPRQLDVTTLLPQRKPFPGEALR